MSEFAVKDLQDRGRREPCSRVVSQQPLGDAMPSGGTLKVSKRLALGAAAVAAVGIAIPSIAAPNRPQGGAGGPQFCKDQMGRTMDGAVTWTPSNLWPANHKMVPVTVSYTEPAGDSDGDTTMVTIDSVQEQDGSNAAQDATVAETLNGSGKPGQVDASSDGAPTAGSDTTPATVVED